MTGFDTYEVTQPWVLYRYGLTHDGWWPLWSSTRVLGVAAIGVECAVCGQREVARMKLPRFGKVPPPSVRASPVARTVPRRARAPGSWRVAVVGATVSEPGDPD